MNGTGNDKDMCAETVPERKALIALRNKVGASSEAGGHISNLIAQLTNYEKETDRGARERLEKFMAASVKTIEALTRDHQ